MTPTFSTTARAAAMATMLAAWSTSAFAQSAGGRMTGPFAGLFGGGTRAENSQSLDLRASIFGVDQRTELPEDFDTSLLDPSFTTSDRFAGATSSLDYTYNLTKGPGSFGIGLSGFVSDYSINPDQPYYGGTANTVGAISTRLTRKITFRAAGQAAYSSQYTFGSGNGLPGGFNGGLTGNQTGIDLTTNPNTPGFNFAPLQIDLIDTSVQSGLSYTINRRSSFDVDLSVRRSLFLSDNYDDFGTVSAIAAYSHQIVRRLRARVGVRREQFYFGDQDGGSEPVQGVFFGLDYGDAATIRLARRTTLAMAASAGSAKDLQGKTQYRLLGSARLNHAMGRTWSAGASYDRSLDFISAFKEAVLRDTGTVFLGGQLAPRLSATTSVALSRGYVGLDTSQHFDNYSATATLNLALNRRMSAFAQYLYYRTSTSTDFTALPLLSSFKRNAATVGVSFFAPLFHSPRVRR